MVKTNVKYLVYAILTTLASLISCDPAQIETSEIEFFIAKEWKIESFYGNGELITEEILKSQNSSHSLENYRLKLYEDFSFIRTGFDAIESSGTWELTAGLSQLILYFNDQPNEHYIILNLEVRKLELRVLKDPEKLGEIDIRYILIPVKE